MEKESFFSGYCRQLDASRMVGVFVVDCELEEADCQYGSCPYQSDCQIAQKIEELLQDK